MLTKKLTWLFTDVKKGAFILQPKHEFTPSQGGNTQFSPTGDGDFRWFCITPSIAVFTKIRADIESAPTHYMVSVLLEAPQTFDFY